jgi:disulfide bond formation protein DsbB
MLVVEWSYLPAEWDRHASAHAVWQREMRLRAGLRFFVFGAPIAMAVGAIERAMLPPLVALVALSVIGAAFGGRVRFLHATRSPALAGRSFPEAIFTSTGVVFGEVARLWRDPSGGLRDVAIEPGDPRYLRLEFNRRPLRPGPILRIPVPDAFDTDLDAFSAQLRSWIARPG